MEGVGGEGARGEVLDVVVAGRRCLQEGLEEGLGGGGSPGTLVPSEGRVEGVLVEIQRLREGGGERLEWVVVEVQGRREGVALGPPEGREGVGDGERAQGGEDVGVGGVGGPQVAGAGLRLPPPPGARGCREVEGGGEE